MSFRVKGTGDMRSTVLTSAHGKGHTDGSGPSRGVHTCGWTGLDPPAPRPLLVSGAQGSFLSQKRVCSRAWPWPMAQRWRWHSASSGSRPQTQPPAQWYACLCMRRTLQPACRPQEEGARGAEPPTRQCGHRPGARTADAQAASLPRLLQQSPTHGDLNTRQTHSLPALEARAQSGCP